MDIFGKQLLQEGTMFGSYQILEEIGRGGMGVVYKALETNPQRFVAIKIILDQQQRSKRRFSREAELASKLQHNNIVKTYNGGEIDGLFYLAIEYVQGQTLSQLLDANNVTTMQGLDILMQVANGLAYAHRHNIIHRDIKPDNIIIDENGTAKIMDFGLAKSMVTEDSLTRTGTMMGSPKYMAPEQLTGKAKDITSKVDIYALGAILYKIVTQNTMISGNSIMEIFYNVKSFKPPSLSTLIHKEDLNINVEDLNTLWQKSIAPADERYKSMEHFVADITKITEKKRIRKEYISLLKIKKAMWATVFCIVALFFMVRFLSEQKNDTSSLYLEAINKFNQHEYSDASKMLTSIPDKKNYELLPFYLGASLYYNNSNKNIMLLQKIIILLEEAYQKFPYLIDIDYLLAKCYFDLAINMNKSVEHLKKAKTYFKECTKLDPFTSEYFSYLAEINLYLGEFDLCQKNIHKTVALNQRDFRAAEILLQLSLKVPFLQADNWLILANIFFYLKKINIPHLFSDLTENTKRKNLPHYQKMLAEETTQKDKKYYIYVAAKAYEKNRIDFFSNQEEVKEIYQQILLDNNEYFFYRFLAAKSLAFFNEYEVLMLNLTENDLNIVGQIIISAVLRETNIPVSSEHYNLYLTRLQTDDVEEKEFMAVLLAESCYIENTFYPLSNKTTEAEKFLLEKLFHFENEKVKLASAASIVNTFNSHESILQESLDVLKKSLDSPIENVRIYSYFHILNSWSDTFTLWSDKNNFDYIDIYKKGLRDKSENINMLCLSFLYKFVQIIFPEANNNIQFFVKVFNNNRIEIKNLDFLNTLQSELKDLMETKRGYNEDLCLQAGCIWTLTLLDFHDLEKVILEHKFSPVFRAMMVRFFMVANFFHHGMALHDNYDKLLQYIQKEKDVVVSANLYFMRTIFTVMPLDKIKIAALKVEEKVAILSALGVSVFPKISPIIFQAIAQNKETLIENFNHENQEVYSASYLSYVALLNQEEKENFVDEISQEKNKEILEAVGYGLYRALRFDFKNDMDSIHHVLVALTPYNSNKQEQMYNDYLTAITSLSDQEYINKSFGNIIEFTKNQPRPYYERAILRSSQGKMEEAKQDVTKAIELLPEYYRYQILLAEVEFARNDFVACQKILSEIVPYENNPFLLKKAGVLYDKLKEYSKMRNVYKKLFVQYPYNKEYLIEIIRSYCKENNKENATLYLQWLTNISERKYLNTKSESDTLCKEDFRDSDFTLIQRESVYLKLPQQK